VAINGGEDYELLLPLLWKILRKLKEILISPSLDMTQESEGIHLITRADTKIPKGTWLGCYDRKNKKKHL
jgi:thiamine-monophosphate kinase